jgi:integrase
LKLPERGSFTGHSLRRTSATLLADSGANILTLKRHGSWKSNSVAESYVSASKTSKLKIAKQISENAPGCSSTGTALERYLPGESKKCCRLYQSN